MRADKLQFDMLTWKDILQGLNQILLLQEEIFFIFCLNVKRKKTKACARLVRNLSLVNWKIPRSIHLVMFFLAEISYSGQFG